jgi:hypothetical protein
MKNIISIAGLLLMLVFTDSVCHALGLSWWYGFAFIVGITLYVSSSTD